MILAILQARTSSTRLPGKVLLNLAGQPMLARQIERIKRSELIDRLIVATSDNEDDNRLAELCAEIEIDCFRGSLDDVLDRFYRAAEPCQPEHVVRLTGDCPLTDPAVIDEVIEFYLSSGSDYASNTLEPTFPDGLDVEVMAFVALEKAWREARKQSEREHVTPYIISNGGMFNVANFAYSQNLSKLRWTVDEPEDFEFVSAVYEELYERNPRFDMADILKLIESRPELTVINKGFVRNEGLAKSLAEDKVLE